MSNETMARFEITEWDPADLPGIDGWTSGVKMAKRFTEGLVGASGGLLMHAGEVEGQRAYMATERITGMLNDGCNGSFVGQHGGLESSPETWFGYIVPGTGIGDFDGITGDAPIRHDEDGAYFALNLREG